MEIGGLADAAATGNNARRNDQATEEGQTGCADSASLQVASKAACTDKPKVKLDKSARFSESLQPGTVMWECQGESARHNRPSPCGVLERVQGDVVTGGPPPLSCSPAIVMQNWPIGLNWTENADNTDNAEIVQASYFI
jgi:hypothetical protein